MEETLSPAQAEVNQLVENGLKALDDFLKLDQDQVDYIVAKCSVAALDKHGELAKLAIEETKRGVFEDKATKNLFACEYVVNHMRHLKSVGVIKEDEVQGLTYVAEPVGVVAGVTPVTNPTSTAIFKSLICLKTRNPIVLSVSIRMPSSAPLRPPRSSMKRRSKRARRKTAFSGSNIRAWKQPRR